MKSCRRFGWVVVTSAMLAPAAPASADDGGVVGWVESTRGVPLAGAVISVFGKTIHGNRVTLSDAQGQFMLPSLPPGSYTLRAVSTGHEPSAARHITVLPDRDALFTLSLSPLGDKPAAGSAGGEESEQQTALREWLWLMRHKRRSVLETASHEGGAWGSGGIARRRTPATASLDDALLAGSVELAASSGATALSADSLGALRLTGRLADGVRWSLGGLIAENEGRAWRMAAQFVIDPGGGHEIDAGAGYGAGDTRTLFASGELQPDRTTGAVFARDRWHVSDRLTATAGGRYTYVGFLSDSHHADAILQIELRGLARNGRAWLGPDALARAGRRSADALDRRGIAGDHVGTAGQRAADRAHAAATRSAWTTGAVPSRSAPTCSRSGRTTSCSRPSTAACRPCATAARPARRASASRSAGASAPS